MPGNQGSHLVSHLGSQLALRLLSWLVRTEKSWKKDITVQSYILVSQNVPNFGWILGEYLHYSGNYVGNYVGDYVGDYSGAADTKTLNKVVPNLGITKIDIKKFRVNGIAKAWANFRVTAGCKWLNNVSFQVLDLRGTIRLTSSCTQIFSPSLDPCSNAREDIWSFGKNNLAYLGIKPGKANENQTNRAYGTFFLKFQNGTYLPPQGQIDCSLKVLKVLSQARLREWAAKITKFRAVPLAKDRVLRDLKATGQRRLINFPGILRVFQKGLVLPKLLGRLKELRNSQKKDKNPVPLARQLRFQLSKLKNYQVSSDLSYAPPNHCGLEKIHLKKPKLSFSDNFFGPQDKYRFFKKLEFPRLQILVTSSLPSESKTKLKEFLKAFTYFLKNQAYLASLNQSHRLLANFSAKCIEILNKTKESAQDDISRARISRAGLSSLTPRAKTIARSTTVPCDPAVLEILNKMVPKRSQAKENFLKEFEFSLINKSIKKIDHSCEKLNVFQKFVLQSSTKNTTPETIHVQGLFHPSDSTMLRFEDRSSAGNILR
ncbi:MAG: hypothetical protein LBF22_11500 [Deltaproteobacteria bacterium]|nr:hypothetical protein [Deltaproteobacteria bacterium]